MITMIFFVYSHKSVGADDTELLVLRILYLCYITKSSFLPWWEELYKLLDRHNATHKLWGAWKYSVHKGIFCIYENITTLPLSTLSFALSLSLSYLVYLLYSKSSFCHILSLCRSFLMYMILLTRCTKLHYTMSKNKILYQK